MRDGTTYRWARREAAKLHAAYLDTKLRETWPWYRLVDTVAMPEEKTNG